MLFSRFFKLAKPNRFEYQPLYYDQEKEELEERVRARNPHNRILESDFSRRERLKGEFTSIRDGSKSFMRKEAAKSRMRLAVILIVLAAITCWFLLRF